MEVIRFNVRGLFNSFKIPTYNTYHKTYKMPPKTTIIGMLANIMEVGEKKFYQQLQKEIDVSVIIRNIDGIVKDLWCYTKPDSGNRGKAVLTREKNHNSEYLIYLQVKDEEIEERVLASLKKPKKIPSLGMDDELVEIEQVSRVDVTESQGDKIDSCFELKEGMDYKIQDFDNGFIKRPKIRNIYTEFNIPYNDKTDKKQKRNDRKVKKTKNILEYSDYTVKLIDSKIDVYEDIEKNLFLSFY